MQKTNIIKIIALTRELKTMNTLLTQKNIIKIKKFKKLMIFRIISKKKNIKIERLLN